MSGVDFLDTHLFFYVVDDGSPCKQAIARCVLTDAHNRQSGVVSFQVVQETPQVPRRGTVARRARPSA